jgi:hypothetical protein
MAFFFYEVVSSAYNRKLLNTFLWFFPLLFTYNLRKNVKENAESVVKEILLHNDG